MQAISSRQVGRLRKAPLIALVIGLAIQTLSLSAAQLFDVPQLGLRVASGFRVTLFAGDNMASDVYSMTLDSRGNVVVSSQGYVRTLYDRNNDGFADDSQDFATTRTGGMGMCFDGTDLMFVGDGALWRYRDANDDGRSDGAPERLLSLAFGEHGGHAVRRGPDGAWYVIGGNDSKFDLSQINASPLPGRRIEGGAILRLGVPGRAAEVIAHGFRNPYDFDFNPSGDIFTYDSDCERDYFLPWYAPTRIYHVAPGNHHGWRLEGYVRSWPRPDYYADSVGILAKLDRGSPTGVACYDHLQFPIYYRGGIFALDWTFGRVYFLSLQGQVDGSSYRGTSETFLESIGTTGFAPTDIAVAPDGSLYISSGGRKSRGAIYRVQYVGDPTRRALATSWQLRAPTELRQVLDAPQPREAWSRALWVPIAERLGAEPFNAVASDNLSTVDQMVRSIEILTDLFGGISPATAQTCASANSPLIRARTAWSLGISPTSNAGSVLLGLARDSSPYVRCRALESLRLLSRAMTLATLQQALAANLAHADKRVHQAASLLATDLPEPAWNALWAQQQSGFPQARLSASLAHLWRIDSLQVNTAAAETALGVLNQYRNTDFRLQALRLIALGLGDFHLDKPSVEVYTAYETPLNLAGHKSLVARLQSSLVKLIPSGDATVDIETARLLSMIQASDPTLPEKIVNLISPGTTPTPDFHYLITLSRLQTRAITNHTAEIADAVLSLDRKLSGLQQRTKQNWDARLAEVATVLLEHDPKLADAMLLHSEYPRAAHLHLVPLLGADRYLPSARLFFTAVQRTPGFRWSELLIDLLSALPPDEVHPLFRRQLSNFALRDRLLIELAPKPLPGDRDAFISGLGSSRPETVRASMTALLQLPAGVTSTKTHVATLRALRHLIKEPKEQTARAQALLLLTHLSGQKFAINETGGDLAKTYRPVLNWFETKFPGILRQLDSDDQENQAQWDVLYQSAQWNRGDATRGATLFNDRGCATCHTGTSAAGPNLAGVAQRFSPEDLMNSIIFPSRDVAPAYRMTTYHLRNGDSYTGLKAFESADGVLFHTGLGSTMRLAESDIASRQPSNLSFMPSGLLAGIGSQGLADLHAYLKTLQH